MDNLINRESLIEKYAKEYAKSLIMYGVDISEKYETAAQNSFMLEQAYIRGRQDERDKFEEYKEKQSSLQQGCHYHNNTKESSIELIDKKSLIINLVDWQMEQFAEIGHEKEFNLLDKIIHGVENEPTVEAKEVIHGEWVDTDFGTHCTACSRSYDPFEIKPREVKKFNFCPNCGANMIKKV